MRKQFLDKAKVACACALPVAGSIATGLTVFAAETGGASSVTESVTGALTTAVTEIAGSVGTAIGSIIPIALPLVGAGLVVTIGLRVFKKVTNNA